MIRTNTFYLVSALSLFAGGALWAVEAKNTPPSAYAEAARTSDEAAARLRASNDLEHAFERVAEVVRPSVVSITATKIADEVQRLPDGFFLFGSPSQQNSPRNRGGDDDSLPREHGMGSGVIVSADGYILTNNHVVAEMSDLKVHLCDEREFPAKLIGTDPRTDLAVVKIDATGLTPAKLGDSEHAKIGQWIAAFGSPFGLEQTMSSGIISAKGRANMHITDFEDFIQTDAAINPGNSGGPLVDLRGEVIGINTAIVSRSGGSQGVGLAIPSAMASQIMDRLIHEGKVVRGWLGVSIQEVTPELARSFQFDAAHGVLVGDVTKDSPAAKAGLESGDIIASIDGRDVENLARFRNQIAAARPDATMALAVWRDGRLLDVSVKVGTAPADRAAPIVEKETREGFGLQLSDVTPAIESQLKLDDGVRGAVVVNVRPNSPAAEAGLVPGDVIIEVDHKTVTDVNSTVQELRAHDTDGAVVRILHDGKTRWLHLGAPAAK